MASRHEGCLAVVVSSTSMKVPGTRGTVPVPGTVCTTSESR